MRLRAALVPCLVLLSGCAWARRENRPVWTFFEDNLVPGSDTAFVAALPATVPLGVVAILTDTFVAHPLQVVDDAAVDAADLWRGIDFEKAYYSEAGMLPVRAIGTPVWFVGSFLGRSLFDMEGPSERAAAVSDERVRQREADRLRQVLAWLAKIEAGGEAAMRGGVPEHPDDADGAQIRAAVERALARGTALGRLRVFETAARHVAFGACVDWCRGLDDPSAVVRYKALLDLPPDCAVPDALADRLLADPDPVVRELAARRRAGPGH
jgi:hypothetical protein